MTHRILKYSKKLIESFLNKSFQPPASNTTIQLKEYALAIAKAAQGNTYIETVGNKADSLHLRIEYS